MFLIGCVCVVSLFVPIEEEDEEDAMGVKGCHRIGCDNTMCDRLSDEFGYICNDCFYEMAESDLDIKTFMETSKKDGPKYNYADEFPLP